VCVLLNLLCSNKKSKESSTYSRRFMSFTFCCFGAPNLLFIFLHFCLLSLSSLPLLLSLINTQDLVSIDSATKVALETVRQDVMKMKQGCMQITNGIRLDQKDNSSLFSDQMSSFLERAEHLRDECGQMLDEVDEEFRALCSYFAAPPPPATAPDDFFALVSSFVKTFTATVTQVDEKAARQQKASMLGRERQAMRSKAKPKRHTIAERPTTHRKKLTGIDIPPGADFSPSQVFKAAEEKRKSSIVMTKASTADTSNIPVDSVDAEMVLKAARRASLNMGL